jgi:hypothetical protein
MFIPKVYTFGLADCACFNVARHHYLLYPKRAGVVRKIIYPDDLMKVLLIILRIKIFVKW